MSMSEEMWEWGGPVEETLRLRRRKSRDEDSSERGLPLPPMSPQWRDHGKGEGGGGVHIVVCCCNEEHEELKVMLSTFRTDKQPSCPVRVSFILDSHSPVDFGARSETYELLKHLLRVPSTDERASFGDYGCMVHTGVMDKTQVIFDLYVKGPTLAKGKRNSLMMFFNDILPAKISRGEAVEPDAVYVLDADSGHPDNGLADIEIMWRLLLCEEETACVTCPVRPVNPYESFLAASQSLEYALVWDNLGESYFGLQIASRGTQCMFKYPCLVEDGRLAQPPCGEGAMPPLLDAFGKTAAGTPALILLDTSPSDGLLVLLRQRGFDARSCGSVDAVTCVPHSWLDFYAQRRRWYAGALVGTLSHLTGKDNYFQNDRHRWILAVYTLIFNIYLHSGVAFLPVLLAKGVSVMVVHLEESRESDDEGQQQEDDGSDNGPVVEWAVFGMLWGFLCVNVVLYCYRSQTQLWMWINVSSVLWMLLCLAVMIGASITTIPYLAVAIVGACFVLAGLSAAGARLPTLGSLAVSALPFVLVTSVHAVLVFLFALATLDSAEWGTREVSCFDSGVTKARAAAIRRKKFTILFFVMTGSCGLGVLLMLFPTYTILPLAVGIPAAANLLKLLVSILPGKLERTRQNTLIGDASGRPLSLRRGMADDMAPIHGRAPDSRERGGFAAGRTRSRKNVIARSPTENGSFVTAEDDGTPSPPGGEEASITGSFFAFPTASALAGGTVSASAAAVGTAAAPPPGHRRHGSTTASASSGFAGVAGVGGVGGVSGGGGGGHSRSHSSSSRRSSRTGGRNEGINDGRSESRHGSRSESRHRSRSGSGSRNGSSSGRRRQSRSRSRSRSRSPPPRPPPRASTADADQGGGGAVAVADGKLVVSPETASVETAAVAKRRSLKGGFNGLFSSTENSPGVNDALKKTPIVRGDEGADGDAAAATAATAGVSGANGASVAVAGSQHASGVHHGDEDKSEEDAPLPSSVQRTPVKDSRGRKSSRRKDSKDSEKFSSKKSVPATPPKAARPNSGRGMAAIRNSLGRGQSTMDSDDGMDFPAMAKAAFERRRAHSRNTLAGLRQGRGGGGGGGGGQSNSESEDGEPARPPSLPRTHSGRRKSGGGGAMAGIRAAWARTSMGSEDESTCPSPATVNAYLNSRAGAASLAAASERSAGGGGGGSRGSWRSSLAGIRSAWGNSTMESDDSIVLPGYTVSCSQPKHPPAVMHAVINEDEDEDEYEDEEYIAHEMAVLEAARLRAGGAMEMSNANGVRGHDSREMQATRGVGGMAGSRRNWGVGQSSVFDTSGSSSSDEGKPRGLHGVQVLGPAAGQGVGGHGASRTTGSGGIARKKSSGRRGAGNSDDLAAAAIGNVIERTPSRRAREGGSAGGSGAVGFSPMQGVQGDGAGGGRVIGSTPGRGVRGGGSAAGAAVGSTPSRGARGGGSAAGGSTPGKGARGGGPAAGGSNGGGGGGVPTTNGVGFLPNHTGGAMASRGSGIKTDRLNGFRVPPLETLQGMPGVSFESSGDSELAFSFPPQQR